MLQFRFAPEMDKVALCLFYFILTVFGIFKESTWGTFYIYSSHLATLFPKNVSSPSLVQEMVILSAAWYVLRLIIVPVQNGLDHMLKHSMYSCS